MGMNDEIDYETRNFIFLAISNHFTFKQDLYKLIFLTHIRNIQMIKISPKYFLPMLTVSFIC